MNYVISIVIEQLEKMYCNNMMYARIDYPQNPFKRKNGEGGRGGGGKSVSLQASHPKGLAFVEESLTFSCYIGWSLHLCIHYEH